MTASPLSQGEADQLFEAAGLRVGQRVGVAVSGGADSMALAVLAARFALVTALVVDHGLRPESAAEAKVTSERLTELGIQSELIDLKLDPAPGNMQARARAARYEAMLKASDREGLAALLLGHHQDDQAETLLMRLAKGSGLKGLAAMQPQVRFEGTHIPVVRPFLSVPKARLRATLRDEGVFWVEDPSNKNDAFDRIKVRKALQTLEDSEELTTMLAETSRQLSRADSALDFFALKLLRDVTRVSEGWWLTVEASRWSPYH